MRRPARLVLLGHPVGHSLSPRIQNAALASAGIPLEYTAIDVEPAERPGTLDRLITERAAGNVTIPHKRAVAARAVLSPLAARVGAVNTFWVEDGRLRGDNTDVTGFDAAVRSLIGHPPHGPVAVFGAGGSASAVLAAVERWPGCVARVHGRTAAHVEELCARYPRASQASPALDAALHGAELVVNATPIGLDSDDYPIPLELIPPNAAIMDLVYRPGGTAWTRAASARGHRASDGLPMLIEQGAHAFERWFSIPADRRAMWRAVAPH